MKRLVIVLLVAAVAVVAGAPPAAAWWGRPHYFRPHVYVGVPFNPPYYYPPVMYMPPPVYYAPPVSAPPVACHTTEGYWTTQPLSTDGGYTTYQQVWVPARTVCR